MHSFIKRCIFILPVILLAACGMRAPDKQEKKAGPPAADSTTRLQNSTAVNDLDTADPTINEYATCYVVVADTGLDYHGLLHKTWDLHRQLGIPIDSMDRSYDQARDLIVQTDNDEDGVSDEYSPRRYTSNNLSLEYLRFYQNGAREKTVALVTGIYETKESADSAVAVIKKIEKKAFNIKANLYMGCLH
ncbi:MAG: hypothetical protein Q8918_14910 [Bacteroidota bacterium]|nr:hypothetical protein [Bacteroidota bacterium]MDP4212308.1 hypothetical protein [Bacteroidota bacterium]MDP4251393.1 hypothetical protein [Bacteroidota bacterium]